MKFGPVTKIDKRNKATPKNIDDDVKSENCYVIDIFQFTVNLEQSRSRIPDVESVKPKFSLTVVFYLTKLKTELQNL